MLTVYAIPVSLYCAKLRILLRHKGLVWEEVAPPGGYGSDAYKQIVPSGNLPALSDGDLLIADSEAIAEYLDERHPDPPMLPPDPPARARARALSRFHDTRLEPALRTLFACLPGRGEAPPGFIAAQSVVISTRLAQLERMLADLPGADGPMLCHCGFPVTFAWLDALSQRRGLEVAWPPGVIAWREDLKAMPAIRAELADYTPKLTAFLEGGVA